MPTVCVYFASSLWSNHFLLIPRMSVFIIFFPELDLSWNTLLLFGILVCLLMLTDWNASSRSLQSFASIVSFLQLFVWFKAIKNLNTLLKVRYHRDALFLVRVYLSSKFFVFLFWTLLAFVFEVRISETFLCSALQVKIAFLPDALQLLMSFVGMLMYLKPNLFLLIIFYNGTFYLLKYELNSGWICVCICILLAA
jgi:hypothetical protein